VRLGDLPRRDLRARLRGEGLRLRIGPFVVRLVSSMAAVETSLATLYAHHEVEPGKHGAHFTMRADHPPTIRRFLRRQVQLTFDGHEPFLPLPWQMAAPMVEAGLNWCVGNFAHQYVVIHAATLERGGQALLMPAPPGSGKSTLCAALVHRGWRLLSDEFALVDPDTGVLQPIPRPVALKGPSIALLRAWSPSAWFGPEVDNNEGETVSYMRPPMESVDATGTRAMPGWIVIPQFVPDAPPTIEPMSRARALMHLADNSFNYNLHGRAGFERLASLADLAPCVRLRYSDLEAGVEIVGQLAAATATRR
jgi:HprK-related kinase A